MKGESPAKTPLTREQWARKAETLRQKGLKIGYTSGAFDIVHLGHVEYLKEAKSHCDLLLVGVNSDASIGRYKDARRPIVSQESRLAVVAAFSFVDGCFIFEEDNNRENILLLRPHYYIKAGDYDAKDLSSAPLMEAWKGEVILIPFREGYSTTGIIEGVLKKYGYPESLPAPLREKKPAIFLDRDGVINVDRGYVGSFEDFQFKEGALEGLKSFYYAGYRLIIVTNQAGIGLGYYRKEDFYEVNRRMLGCLSEQGIILDKIYYCPHSLEEACSCRKPKTGLLERGIEECRVIVEKSWMIGDHETDVEAGRRVGLKTLLISDHDKITTQADRVASNLLEAYKRITA